MNDDIVRGLISGLIGPPLFEWAKKYSYLLVFIATIVIVQACLILSLVDALGWRTAVQKAWAPVAIAVSIGCGALAVICVFVGRITSPKERP
ncbi:hypothetical protein KZ686_18750 [Cupriavidus cauae]|uniref:hypothetical protein n=1 Tax=Cupriavidus cauae TaxID=2608999 RepID=UPI002243BB5F|nr:hypothetical protein [Cupriavidus cauae]UZN52131.1 hypothetical protein KZ686_18750 [Cupriavidus cauae]